MLMVLLLGLVLAEFLLYIPPLWNVRVPLTAPFICLLPGLSIAWVVMAPGLYSEAFFVISTLRLFNFLRIAKGRIKPDHLLRSSWRVTVAACAGQLLVLLVAAIGVPLPSLSTYGVLLAIAQYAVALGLFGITLRNLRTSHYVPSNTFLADRDLPSITVAIPARNETLDLEDCLHSVLSSNYPKLEVIVLDDSSQDRTPEIIRKFAHDGVRFVQGTEPDDHWLAKNLACQRLMDEASGEYILFCGVDVRFGPESLRRLVTAMVNRNKKMVSIMPRRFTDSIAGAFIQPMRYWWEFALPRRFFDRPPVLSTCWIIEAKALKRLGGFASVSHNIIPESYFARELIKTDAYSFLRSDSYMNIETRKSTAEQRATAIRVRYPQLHKRPELAFGLTIFDLLVLIGPFVLAPLALAHQQHETALIAAASATFLVATHVCIVASSSPPSVVIALVNFPLAVLSELFLGLTSMYKYEFSSVTWKGRKITPAPRALEVIPKLPDLR